MIKFTGRRNIIYIIQLILWSTLRSIDKDVLSKVFNFSYSSIFTVLMFFGEFSSGSIVYKYQSKYLRRKENSGFIAKIIKNISSNKKRNKPSKLKIYTLLLFATFFDFVEFIITTFYLQKLTSISYSFDSRCNSFLAICNAFAYRYLLKFNIFKHQIFSLIIISTCFIIVIASEYAFQNINEIFTYGEFTLSLGLILVEYFYLSMMDTIDKYLLEFDSVDPFYIIRFEGLVGTFLGILFCFVENPLPALNNIYNSKSTGLFILFLFLLFLFYLFSATRNAFRIMVSKLYSPMVLTLSDYFFNPLYLIINYIEGDFKSKNGQNTFYFVLNLIVSLLNTFSTVIFNEFIVLFCCGLEHNTYYQISERSMSEEIEMNKIDISNETQSENDEEEIYTKNGTYKIYV